MSETFAERLRRLRTAKGLSTYELARRMNVTHSVITRAEYGDQHVRAWRLPTLARLLGVSTDYLLTGQDDPLFAALKAQIRAKAPYDRLAAMVASHDAG